MSVVGCVIRDANLLDRGPCPVLSGFRLDFSKQCLCWGRVTLVLPKPETKFQSVPADLSKYRMPKAAELISS